VLNFEQFKVVAVLVKGVESYSPLNHCRDFVESVTHSFLRQLELRGPVIESFREGFLLDPLFDYLANFYLITSVSLVNFLQNFILIN